MLFELRCNRCRSASEFEVACATVYPRAMELREAEAWDGILLWRIFDCPACAAQDDSKDEVMICGGSVFGDREPGHLKVPVWAPNGAC